MPRLLTASKIQTKRRRSTHPSPRPVTSMLVALLLILLGVSYSSAQVV
ncbi:MAG: hypothetical protein U0744_20290 [Gemmataceae bacterium]